MKRETPEVEAPSSHASSLCRKWDEMLSGREFRKDKRESLHRSWLARWHLFEKAREGTRDTTTTKGGRRGKSRVSNVEKKMSESRHTRG